MTNTSEAIVEVTAADIELATRIISNVRGFGITINPGHSAARAIAEYRIAAEQSRASTPAVGREDSPACHFIGVSYSARDLEIAQRAACAIVPFYGEGAHGEQEAAAAGKLWNDHPAVQGALRALYEARAILALHPPASDDAIAAKDAEIARKDDALRAVLAAIDVAVRPDGGDWQFDFEQAPLWVGDGHNDGFSYLERITAWEVGPGEAGAICESLNTLTSMALFNRVRAALASLTEQKS